MTFRQKWDNYWYHYKWITFGIIFAVALLVVSLMSCSGRKVPDLYMVYMSDSIIADADIERIETSFVEDCSVSDVNGDDVVVGFMEHIVSTFNVNDYVDEGTASKLQTVLYGGQHTLMMVHKYALEDYDGFFEDLSSRVQDGDDTFVSPSEGFVTGISVRGNEYLENLGINTENLYLAIRRRAPEDIKEGKEGEYFEEAYKVIEYILNHQR